MSGAALPHNPLVGISLLTLVETGGVRKLRFAAKGRGKSGEVRAIYYFYDKENPLYAIYLYGKNEQVDLSPAKKKKMMAFAATIKAAARARKRSR